MELMLASPTPRVKHAQIQLSSEKSTTMKTTTTTTTLLAVAGLLLLLHLGARADSGECTGSTAYNSSAPNGELTRAFVPPSEGRNVLHYVVPAGTAALLVYAQACYGNVSLAPLSYQLAPWDNETFWWTPTPAAPKKGFRLLAPDAGGLIYLSLRGLPVAGALPEFANANASGVMSVLATNDFADLDDLVPVPGAAARNDSRVSTVLKLTKGRATVTWATTGDSRDTYSVWRYDTPRAGDWDALLPPPGFFLTSCSTRCWMARDDAATAAVTVAGTAASTTVEGLDKRTVTMVAVVVERQGGGESQYQIIALNAARPALAPSALLLMLMLLLCAAVFAMM